MPNISIPTRYREGLTKLAGFSDSQFDELRIALETTPAVANESFFVRKIRESVSTIVFADLRDTIQSIASVRAVLDVSPRPYAELLKAIASSSVLELDVAKQAELHKRLELVLTIGSIRQTSKAESLLSEQSNIVLASRIMTTVKPVFMDEPTEGPHSSLITHSLKVHFIGEDSRHHDIYLSMDADSLKELRKAIERAESKEIALRKILEDTQLKALEVSMQDGN